MTGSISASGLDDPQYLLSFVPVQRLMLQAAERSLTKAEIQSAVEGTPATLDQLLKLELLRPDSGGNYRLNYLLLTKKDQQIVYAVGARYGRSLADAFRAHKAEFDEIVNRYPDSAVRSQLLFDLIAGAALNWEGLNLTTELGYRVKPPHHAIGGTYLVHSAENGAQLDFTGLYLDSQSAPGSVMSFATFGDGASIPRLQGIPDVFDGLDDALNDWRKQPDVYGALRSEYIVLILSALDDAGQVMSAIADGSTTEMSLLKELSIPESRVKSVLHLLAAVGYVRQIDHRYEIEVPLLTKRDKPVVDAALKLSREVMTEWLNQNYPSMKRELSNLSPMRNGVPFSLAFSEVWHYEFGFATKSLAESGFYANPRAPGNRYPGYVPFVWASSILPLPGS